MQLALVGTGNNALVAHCTVWDSQPQDDCLLSVNQHLDSFTDHLTCPTIWIIQIGYQRCSIEMCKSTPELGSRAAVAAVGPSHGNQGNDCRANEKIGAGRAVHDYRWWRD